MPRDSYIPESEHPPTTLPKVSKGTPRDSRLMSIGYLCTSPAAQTANTAPDYITNHNFCAPAKDFGSQDEHTKGFPKVQPQGRFSGKSHDGNRQEERTSTAVAVPPPQNRASSEGQALFDRAQDALNLDRKLRRQKLATLDTNFHAPNAVPKLCNLPLLDSRRTEDTRENLQTAPQHISQGCEGKFEKDTPELIKARIRNVQCDEQNPFSGDKDLQDLKTVTSEVQGKGGVDLQAKAVTLSNHQGDASLTIDEPVQAAQYRPETTDAVCPESSICDDTLAASGASSHDKCSMTDAVSDQLEPFPGQLKGVNAGFDEARLEKPSQ